MSEITYKELDRYLKKNNSSFPSVVLIYGEEYLFKNAIKNILDNLLPESDRSLNYEALDGENENVSLAIEKVNTFSLLSDKKVVALLDSRIFYSKQDSQVIYEKAKTAFKENNLKKAATFFLSYLSVLNVDFDDLSEENRGHALQKDLPDADETEWLDKMIRYCLAQGLSVSSSGGHAERLTKAIEKGFPGENHLIISTELVDKRRLLFKCIKENGLIVNCSVPKGSRKADKDIQTAVLNESLKNILDKSGKSMDPGAFKVLYDKTGFDLRTFTGNIEKLVDFVGDRNRITAKDVSSLLNRTKVDPIFELTNAVADRKTEVSLFYVESLLSAGLHPLQIIAAITNQLRKLLLCRSLIDDLSTAGWHLNMPYNEFRIKIIPLMVERDAALSEKLMQWESELNPENDTQTQGMKKKPKKNKKTASTDLVVAKNPNNAYPIYQILRKSSLFSIEELISAMEHMGQADHLLKSTALEAKIILEKAIVSICDNP